MHPATAATQRRTTHRYPHFHWYSGIRTFMPYQPTIRVRGRKMVLITVKYFITRFRRMSSWAW